MNYEGVIVNLIVTFYSYLEKMTKLDNSKFEDYDLLKKPIEKKSKKDNRSIKRTTKIQLLFKTVYILVLVFIVQTVFIGYVMVKLQALNARLIKLEENNNNVKFMFDYAYDEHVGYINDIVSC